MAEAADPAPAPTLTAAQFNTFLNHYANAAPRSGSKKLTPLTKASDDEWRTWKENFLIVAEINRWNDLRKRQEAAAAMEGSAKRAVADIKHDANNLNIEDLLDAYEKRFVTQASSDLARVTFIRATQDHDETVLAWHSRVRDSFVRAYPNETVDTSRTLIDRFTLGLKNGKLAEFVWDKRPATFSEALNAANDKVASLAVLASRQSGSFGPNQQLPGGIRIKQEPGIHALNGFNSHNNPRPFDRFDQYAYPDVTCYRCQKQGHFAKECRQKMDGFTSPSKRRYNSINVGPRRDRTDLRQPSNRTREANPAFHLQSDRSPNPKVAALVEESIPEDSTTCCSCRSEEKQDPSSNQGN